MSVICCRVEQDKISIASDSICVSGCTQSKGDRTKSSKLIRVNDSDDFIIGSCGYAEECALMNIYAKSRSILQPSESGLLDFLVDFSEWKNKRISEYKVSNAYIFIIKDKAFITNSFLVEEIKTYDAIGAGRDFALSALYLGADVHRAVKSACHLSIYCEEPVILHNISKN